MKKNAIRNIGFVVIAVLGFGSRAIALDPTTKLPDNYSLNQKRRIEIPARSATLPFYVYGDESGMLSNFVGSGYMGDTDSLSSVTSIYDESAPASSGRTGKTSLVVRYSGKGRNGWAGIYWLTPANNWAKIKGAGYNLTQATRLTFWARGAKGGEHLASVKVGGVTGPYPDSDVIDYGPLTLTNEWKQYTVDLRGKDLRHIIGGFFFIIRRSDNPRGAEFYFDEIVFQGDGALSYGFDVASSTEAVQEKENVIAVSTKTVMAQPKTPVVTVQPKPRKNIGGGEKKNSAGAAAVGNAVSPVMEPPKRSGWLDLIVLIEKAIKIQPSPYALESGLFYTKHVREEIEKEQMAPMESMPTNLQ